MVFLMLTDRLSRSAADTGRSLLHQRDARPLCPDASELHVWRAVRVGGAGGSPGLPAAGVCVCFFVCVFFFSARKNSSRLINKRHNKSLIEAASTKSDRITGVIIIFFLP